MTAEERMQIVSELERRGAFMVRGAVEVVAQRLDVSRFTIYGYLKQIRAASAHEVSRAKSQRTAR
jgi:predicted transcriptional regulator YheO